MSSHAPDITPPRQPPIVHRIGSVSYLNARPLIWGLDRLPDVELSLDVPARLLDGLRDGWFDVALLPVIDYQRMEGLRILPAGGIGCDGATLTVRIFSRVPIERITVLHCDTESHTSVALARILYAEIFRTRPELAGLNADGGQPGRSAAAAPPHRRPPEAMLLIGDKVVCEEPADYPHQLDLGAAWKQLTGLPFVFAAWTARAAVDAEALAQRLLAARREGLGHVEQIVAEFAVPRGWPAGLARDYLRHSLYYEIGPRQIEAIGLFHQLAAKHGLIPAPPRPLEIITDACTADTC